MRDTRISTQTTTDSIIEHCKTLIVNYKCPRSLAAALQGKNLGAVTCD